MSSRLIGSLATTEALASAFSDRALLQAMVDFEAALARAQAGLGLVPRSAAEAIGRAASVDHLDLDAIVAGARANATASLPVVRALEARVEAADPEAARYVHLGATSQDVFDTALVLCIRAAWTSIDADHWRLVRALARLAEAHAGTVMLGRTLLQPAPPITFGLKAASWLGAVARSWRGCATAYEHAMVLQFGGATGTLAALGTHGVAVEQALARELGLAVPDAPWHAHRDRLAALVAACGVHTMTLGKIARDISLLMQHEVAEVFEPGGGSSSMPHKHNPAGCAVVLSAATRMPGLVATMLASGTHEHERSVGGWHAEGPVVADAIQTAGSALSAMADVIDGLAVDIARMRQNIDATRGIVFAERVAVTIAPKVGRTRAAELVRSAVAVALRSGATLTEAVGAMPELANLLSAADLAGLAEPRTYLGSTDKFRERLLGAANTPLSGKR
jgi:3-carboxy-cis,cis-muconate cycloisomerase